MSGFPTSLDSYGKLHFLAEKGNFSLSGIHNNILYFMNPYRIGGILGAPARAASGNH